MATTSSQTQQLFGGTLGQLYTETKVVSPT